MRVPDDLPILGGANGGGQLAAIDKTYAVELCTTDGESHILTVNFDRPTDPGGVVNLGALKGFDPKAQAMSQVQRVLTCAQLGILLNKDDKVPPVVVIVEGGACVVWRHVTSFQYLGEWDKETGAPVDAEEKVYFRGWVDAGEAA